MASAVTLPAVCATTECVAKGFPSCSQGVCLHCVTENVWAIKTVKGLHDNVLFTFSKKYTGQSRLYKHQEKHWLLLIPNSNLSLCWSSRYLFTWFTFTPVFMRTWSHMFALICVSVSATLCKAINAIIALIWTCLLHVFMILFKEGSTLSVQFILNRLLHNM